MEGRLEKAKVNAYEKSQLVRSKKRVEGKLEKARVGSVVKKRLIESKKRLGDRLTVTNDKVRRMKYSNNLLKSRLDVAVSPKPGPSPSAYSDLSRRRQR